MKYIACSVIRSYANEKEWAIEIVNWHWENQFAKIPNHFEVD